MRLKHGCSRSNPIGIWGTLLLGGALLLPGAAIVSAQPPTHRSSSDAQASNATTAATTSDDTPRTQDPQASNQAIEVTYSVGELLQTLESSGIVKNRPEAIAFLAGHLNLYQYIRIPPPYLQIDNQADSRLPMAPQQNQTLERIPLFRESGEDWIVSATPLRHAEIAKELAKRTTEGFWFIREEWCAVLSPQLLEMNSLTWNALPNSANDSAKEASSPGATYAILSANQHAAFVEHAKSAEQATTVLTNATMITLNGIASVVQVHTPQSKTTGEDNAPASKPMATRELYVECLVETQHGDALQFEPHLKLTEIAGDPRDRLSNKESLKSNSQETALMDVRSSISMPAGQAIAIRVPLKEGKNSTTEKYATFVAKISLSAVPSWDVSSHQPIRSAFEELLGFRY